MVRELLESMSPEKEWNKDALIALKPNLVVSKPSDSGATTSPQVTRGVIEHLIEKGFNNLVIMESSWVGDSTMKAFKVCGYEKLAREYNIDLIDMKKDKAIKKKGKNLTISLCEMVLEIDYLINLPVLKSHCQTRLTCALKNLKGLIPDKEKRRFHDLGLHKPIAELNSLVKTDLIIVDAVIGDLTHEEGGNPVEMGRIIGGTDPVLVDSYSAELIGVEVEEIPYISMSNQMGIGKLFNNDTVVKEYRLDNYPQITLKPSPRVRRLAEHIEEGGACSPCYGALIHALSRLEERGALEKIPVKIFIGRKYKDIESSSLGIGMCTAKFNRNVSGCPPKARDIVKYLEEHFINN
ncbi:DUF362 domain-containing protein [Candidatus Contubernalis alkalaceticus]|nr:DUF362 domain-containing protein [Candidatus Contubernalis alkalaceticus]